MKRKKTEDKLQNKQHKELEKQNSKAIKEAEKLVAKQTDKSEVSKYLEVVIDPQTINCPPGNEVLSALQNPPDGKEAHKFTVRVEGLAVPQSLTWRRKIVTFSTNNCHGEVKLNERWQVEGRALLLISTLDLVDMLVNNTLDTWTRECKRKLGGAHLSLMVYSFQEYFKEEKNTQERLRKAKVRGEKLSKKDAERLANPVTKYDFEEALASLALDGLADNYTFDKTSEGWKDLSCAVFHHTRAVAETPSKLARELSGAGGFNFWAKEGGKDCVDVKNLAEYWKQVLMTVTPQAGLEKVTALVSQFPSPRALLQAYSACPSIKQREELLANIEVRRTANILGGKRKIGPDISKKIYTVLTCDNPDTILSQKLQ